MRDSTALRTRDRVKFYNGADDAKDCSKALAAKLLLKRCITDASHLLGIHCKLLGCKLCSQSECSIDTRQCHHIQPPKQAHRQLKVDMRGLYQADTYCTNVWWVREQGPGSYTGYAVELQVLDGERDG